MKRKNTQGVHSPLLVERSITKGLLVVENNEQGGERLSFLKEFFSTTFKILIFLIIGFSLTFTVLRAVYENFDIKFIGNLWVNWFGVSYLLYFLYTLLSSVFVNANVNLFKERKTSIIFWILLMISLYIVFIPFVKGENPF